MGSDSSEPERWKLVLQQMKGRAITGYATGALGGKLQDLTITLDDGSWVTLSVQPGWIQVERHEVVADGS